MNPHPTMCKLLYSRAEQNYIKIAKNKQESIKIPKKHQPGRLSRTWTRRLARDRQSSQEGYSENTGLDFAEENFGGADFGGRFWIKNR